MSTSVLLSLRSGCWCGTLWFSSLSTLLLFLGPLGLGPALFFSCLATEWTFLTWLPRFCLLANLPGQRWQRKFLTPSWAYWICSVIFWDDKYLSEHCGHWKGFSLAWTPLICMSNVAFWLNLWGHSWQRKFFSFRWVPFTCRSKFPATWNDFEQKLQLKGLSLLWTFRTCKLTCLASLKDFEQLGHGKLFSWLFYFPSF